MEKVLPLIDPLIETYQGESFVLAIMMSYSNTKNILHNNYINLATNMSENNVLQLRFLNSLWENYRLAGYATMQLYYRNSIEKECFTEFFKQLIDSGEYLMFFCVDEYYLSFSAFYSKKHFYHDLYIYGYSGDYFMALAYKDRHLSRILVSAEELKESIYRCRKREKDIHICTFNVESSPKISIDINAISNELKNYLNGVGFDTYIEGDAVGINVYDAIQAYLQTIINECDAFFDIRLFRELWEHKKIMSIRLKELDNILNDSEMIDRSKVIQKMAKEIFLLAMKYTIQGEKDTINYMIDKINQLRISEKRMLEDLVENIALS